MRRRDPKLIALLDAAHGRMGEAIRERDQWLARGAKYQTERAPVSAMTCYGMAGEAIGRLLDARLEIKRLAKAVML